jgi:hypothetical protein
MAIAFRNIVSPVERVEISEMISPSGNDVIDLPSKAGISVAVGGQRNPGAAAIFAPFRRVVSFDNRGFLPQLNNI